MAENKKSLGIRYKDKAEDALKQLDDLEENELINPYHKDFDPKETLKELNQKKSHPI